MIDSPLGFEASDPVDSSAILRALSDEDRLAIAQLEIEPLPAPNAQIAIEDEFQPAERSVINQRTRDVIGRDLPTFAVEGMTAERWAKVRLRAMWLADKFIDERVRAAALYCDDCGFDPTTRGDLSSIKPRSLLDVHHKDPLAEGERYTTTADFALLCPTCHRIAHSLIRLSHQQNL